MKDKAIEQKLTLYRTLITIFWTSSFILGGGLFGLAFNLKHWVLILLFNLGIVFEVILFSLSIGLIFRCKNLIKNLQEIY